MNIFFPNPHSLEECKSESYYALKVELEYYDSFIDHECLLTDELEFYIRIFDEIFTLSLSYFRLDSYYKQSLILTKSSTVPSQ
jgi:hypothetical protein